jgi:hypothetical protein
VKATSAVATEFSGHGRELNADGQAEADGNLLYASFRVFLVEKFEQTPDGRILFYSQVSGQFVPLRHLDRLDFQTPLTLHGLSADREHSLWHGKTAKCDRYQCRIVGRSSIVRCVTLEGDREGMWRRVTG